MQIVGRSEDYTSSDPTLNPPIVEGQKNPMRRDTVQVPSMHSITLRVIADNPGVWLFHCTSLPSNQVQKKGRQRLLTFLTQNRPHRVAFAGWSRCDLHRGSSADPGARQGRLPAVYHRPMHVAGYPRVRQRCGPPGPLRPHWTTERTIPAKQRLARQGHRCHVWVRTLSLLSVRPDGLINGFRCSCVLTAVIGMATVVWYAWTEKLSEEEIEDEARAKAESKKAPFWKRS